MMHSFLSMAPGLGSSILLSVLASFLFRILCIARDPNKWLLQPQLCVMTFQSQVPLQTPSFSVILCPHSLRRICLTYHALLYQTLSRVADQSTSHLSLGRWPPLVIVGPAFLSRDLKVQFGGFAPKMDLHSPSQFGSIDRALA